MRLSDVEGDRCLDVVADIIGPICTIAESEAGKELFKREKIEGNPRDVVLARVKNYVPALIKECKGEIVQILATIEGVTPAEYSEGLTLSKLMGDVFELITDNEFLSFLPFAGTETE